MIVGPAERGHRADRERRHEECGQGPAHHPQHDEPPDPGEDRRRTLPHPHLLYSRGEGGGPRTLSRSTIPAHPRVSECSAHDGGFRVTRVTCRPGGYFEAD